MFPSFPLRKTIYWEVIYVQLAKLAGNTVVATCGGQDKAKLLKELGVDRVIDYRAEDIKTVCESFSLKLFIFSCIWWN